MSTVTEDDLKELKELINNRFDVIEKGQIELRGLMGIIDARIKNLETSSQKIPDLAEKVGELKNWKQKKFLIWLKRLENSKIGSKLL